MIDDIQKGRNSPQRYPIKLSDGDQEKPKCDILFAYDFDH